MEMIIEMVGDSGLLEVVAAGLVFASLIFIAAMIFGVIGYLMRAIGFGAMFRKAGVDAWKAFIPLYNTYNNYKLSWKGEMFFLYAALMVASSVLVVFSEGFMGLVSLVVSLALIYVIVKQNIRMAKLFGKGVGTGILLILFPGITSLVLGLGKSEYAPLTEDEGFAVEFNFSIKPKGEKAAKAEKTVAAEEAVVVEEAVAVEEAVIAEETVTVEETVIVEEADDKADIAE